VGDSIEKDVQCANLFGARSVYMAYNPDNKVKNYKLLDTKDPKYRPDFTILDLRQLNYIFDVIEEDIRFIEKQSIDF